MVLPYYHHPRRRRSIFMTFSLTLSLTYLSDLVYGLILVLFQFMAV
jgi:hypothetical protein